MIALNSAQPGRVPKAPSPPLESRHPGRPVNTGDAWWTIPWRAIRWMYRGYTSLNATDMSAAVAFNLMVALVPMLLLLVAIAGLFLRSDTVLEQAQQAVERLVPGATADDAFTAAITARRNSGWLGVLSFMTLAWAGTGFVSCLGRCMNRIYGARPTGYLAEKQRGFLVLLIFSLLFLVASLASIIPTFLASRDLPGDVERWLVFSQQARLIGYATGLGTALLMFLTLYRIVPNAGQRIADVWPGTVLAALVFLAVSQAFPLYIGLIGGGNRYGQILGFVSLLVLSVVILAHIILFGTYVNAAWQRRRRLHRQRPADGKGVRTGPYGGTEIAP